MVGLLRSRLISVGNAVIAEVQKQVHVRRKPTGYHKRLDQPAIIMKSIELADLRAVQYQERIIDSQDKQECSRPVLEVKKECGQCEIEANWREWASSHRAGSALTSARSVC